MGGRSVTSNQSAVTSYRYNGLGDRLQETVTGGGTTTFSMDISTSVLTSSAQRLNAGLNTSLTQASLPLSWSLQTRL
ncbi:MAG TPA: hypothetical protein DCG54_02540 [Anaerolineae bacterium]|nr:hypothetical protein [Anaerolineae bacterium]